MHFYKSSILNCERGVFTKEKASLEHHQRSISDSRLVYIPQEAGNITAVPGTEQMCVLARAQCRSDWSGLKIVYACVAELCCC